jgi:putative membrane protein insertion efficiency factor
MMKRLLCALIRGYQLFVSRWLHALIPGSGCRFHPTCSEYALDALQVHGVLRGFRLAVWRVLRCHPWGGGGEDPVPPLRSETTHDSANPEATVDDGAHMGSNAGRSDPGSSN